MKKEQQGQMRFDFETMDGNASNDTVKPKNRVITVDFTSRRKSSEKDKEAEREAFQNILSLVDHLY